jgi:ABC-2 type transport system ATP-binding protein
MSVRTGYREVMLPLLLLPLLVPVLLLDEPFTGLDPGSARRLAGRVTRQRDEGRTVVLVSHDLARAAELADAALVLRRGRVALEAEGTSLTPDALADALAGGVL